MLWWIPSCTISLTVNTGSIGSFTKINRSDSLTHALCRQSFDVSAVFLCLRLHSHCLHFYFESFRLYSFGFILRDLCLHFPDLPFLFRLSMLYLFTRLPVQCKNNNALVYLVLVGDDCLVLSLFPRHTLSVLPPLAFPYILFTIALTRLFWLVCSGRLAMNFMIYLGLEGITMQHWNQMICCFNTFLIGDGCCFALFV